MLQFTVDPGNVPSSLDNSPGKKRHGGLSPWDDSQPG